MHLALQPFGSCFPTRLQQAFDPSERRMAGAHPRNDLFCFAPGFHAGLEMGAPAPHIQILRSRLGAVARHSPGAAITKRGFAMTPKSWTRRLSACVVVFVLAVAPSASSVH